MTRKSPLFPPLTAEGQRILDSALRLSTGVFEEMSRRRQGDFFPRDLSPEEVYEHLQTHIAAYGERSVVGRAEQSAVAVIRADERTAKGMLDRLDGLVDGNHLPGTTARGDFFPVGPGAPADSARLLAMAEGIAKHGLPGLPSEMNAGAVREFGQRLAVAEVTREEAGRQRKTALATRQNLAPRTKEIGERLSSIIRAHYGRYSSELAAYGLPVRKRVKKAARKAAPVPAPVAAAIPASTPASMPDKTPANGATLPASLRA